MTLIDLIEYRKREAIRNDSDLVTWSFDTMIQINLHKMREMKDTQREHLTERESL